MRPKSAMQDNRKKSKKKNRTNTQIVSSSASRKLDDSRNREWEYKVEQLKLCVDPKSIPLIHAYQPHRLKQCLVKDPKSYKKFYATHGQCSLSNLYTSSFLAHLREWKKSIRERLGNLLNMVFVSDQIETADEEEKVKNILKEIKSITQELQECTKAIKQSKKQSSAEIRNLQNNFQLLSDYIEHIQIMLEHLYTYNKELNELIENEAENHTTKEIQKKIKKIHHSYEKKIMESLRYCSFHPESSLLNRAQYRMKLKFDSIAKQLIQALEKIEKLKKVRDDFKMKIRQIDNGGYESEECSVKYLQQLLEVLTQNEISRMNLADRVHSYKAQQMLYRLQQQIRQQEEQFLIKFKFRSLLIIKNEHDKIKKNKVLQGMKDHGKTIKKSKKKLLILAKIYSKNNSPDYHKILSDCIKSTSEHFQNLQQIIEILKSMSKDKKFQSKTQVFDTLGKLVQPIENFEENKNKICEEFLLVLIESSFHVEKEEENEILSKDSQKIKRLKVILEASDKEVNEILSKGYGYDQKKVCGLQEMKRVVIKGNNNLAKFEGQKLGTMVNYSHELRMLVKDELIQTVLLFEEDINREQIHGFEYVKECYNNLYLKKKGRQINKKSMENMLQFYRSLVDKCENLKNRQRIQQFLTYMFVNKVCEWLLTPLQKVHRIMQNKENSHYYNIHSLHCPNSYRESSEVRELVDDTCYMLLKVNEKIMSFSDISIYSTFVLSESKNIMNFNEEQRVHEQFDNSNYNNSYYASGQALLIWSKLQFSYGIDRSVDEKEIGRVRREYGNMFNKQIEKMTKLKMQSRDNKFLDAIKQKIMIVNNLLIGATKQTEYVKIVNKICSYLREIKQFHIGICLGNNDPIAFILYNYDFNDIISYLELKLGLTEGTLERNQSIFQPIQTDSLMKELVDTYGASFILSSSKKDRNTNKNEETNRKLEGLFILKNKKQPSQIEDQVVEEYVEDIDENIGEDIDGNVDEDIEQVEQGNFILEERNKEIDEIQNKERIEEQQRQQERVQYECRYYKIDKVKNIDELKSCLKFYRTERSSIVDELRVQLLLLCFEERVPDELKMHLGTVLNSSTKSNLISIFNKVNRYSKTQQSIHELMESLQGKREKRIEKLENVLDLMNITYEIVYEGDEYDKLIMCDMGEKGHYCHAILNDTRPFTHNNLTVPLCLLQELQGQIWKSLLFQKNSNIDKVHELIISLNQMIEDRNAKMVGILHRYKEDPITNGAEIDSLVRTYVQDIVKPENRIRLMGTIDISSLYNVLLEMESIPCLQKFKCHLVCRQNILYRGQNYNNITKFIKSTQILPDKYVKAEYIERKSVSEVELKIDAIANNEMKALKSVKDIPVQEILKALRSGKCNEQFMKKMGRIKEVTENEDMEKVVKVIQALELEVGLKEEVKMLRQRKQLLWAITSEAEERNEEDAIFLIQDNELNQDEFEQMNSFSFIMDSSKVERVNYSSEYLNSLCQRLGESKIGCRKIIFQNKTIGIADDTSSDQDSIAKALGITNPEGMEIRNQNNNIIITYLKVWLLIGKVSEQNKEMLESLSEKYILQVHNGRQSSQYSIDKQSFNTPICIECCYNKKPLLIQLKEQGNEQTKVIHKCQLKNYNYGSKYLIKKVVGFLNQKCNNQRVKQEEAEERRIQMLKIEREKEKEREREREREKKQEQERLEREREEETKRKVDEERQRQREEKLMEEERRKRQYRLNLRRLDQKGEQESSEMQISVLHSQGQQIEEIKFMKIDMQKMQTNLSEYDEINIVLSQAADIDRQQLIEDNPYEFQNVHELIRERRERSNRK